MKNTDTTRMHGLDTLRACAILMVMTFHERWSLPEAFGPLASVGWMGVDLFFVLSGYLIGLQLLRPYLLGQTPGVGEFYRRRGFRILPAYLVVVALYFLVPMWRERPGIEPVWKFLTFTENMLVNYSVHQAFSHVWSLCVEEHFYLLLPWIVLGVMRRPTPARVAGLAVGVVALGMAARAWELHALRHMGRLEYGFGAAYIERVYYPTYCRLDGLLAGVLLAAMEVFRPAWWRHLARWGHVSMALGFALFAVACWMFAGRFDTLYGAAGWSTVIGFPLLSVGLGLIVASSVSDHGLLRRRVPGAGVLATLAYGLYLTHKAVIHVVQRWWPGLEDSRSWLAVGVYLLSCFGVAGLLYLGVERPFMRLRDRAWRSSPERLDPAL